MSLNGVLSPSSIFGRTVIWRLCTLHSTGLNHQDDSKYLTEKSTARWIAIINIFSDVPLGHSAWRVHTQLLIILRCNASPFRAKPSQAKPGRIAQTTAH